MERGTAYSLVSTALRQRGESILLCELVMQYKGNVVGSVYSHSDPKASESPLCLGDGSPLVSSDRCISHGKSRILVLSSGGSSSQGTYYPNGVDVGLFSEADHSSSPLADSRQTQPIGKLYLFSDVTFLPASTSVSLGMTTNRGSLNANSMIGIEQKREYDLSRLESLTIPINSMDTNRTNDTNATSPSDLTSIGGGGFSSSFVVFDISDAPTPLSFSFESIVQRDTVVRIIKGLLRPFGERLDRVMSITTTPNAEIISFSNKGQQQRQRGGVKSASSLGRDATSLIQLIQQNNTSQDKPIDMDDLKQQRREQLQEAKHRAFGAREQEALLYYMSQAAASLSSFEGNDLNVIDTTQTMSDSSHKDENNKDKGNVVEYNNNTTNNNKFTTTRLFDGIHHFSHLLDLKTQQLELSTIKSIISTKQAWETVAMKAGQLASALISVDNRISEYSNHVLSRRMIIDTIEHKSIELKRQERNLTILHTRMSLLRDHLSLKDEMVTVINNMLRLGVSMQLNRKERKDAEVSILESQNKSKGPIGRLLTSSPYKNRNNQNNITGLNDDIVAFFLNDYNCVQINEAMALMDKVLGGTATGKSTAANNQGNIGTRFTSSTRTPLEQEFPIAAVIERKKYYTELRYFICQFVKLYILSFLSVYERFLTTWVPHVTFSNVHKNKLTPQQTQEMKLYQRYGILYNAEEVPGRGRETSSSFSPSCRAQTQSLSQYAIGGVLNNCPAIGEPRWSKGSASSIVITTHDEVHTKIASVQRVLCDMFRVDPEGYEQVLRRYTTVMNISYRMEVKSFFSSLEEAVRKVGWRDDHTGSSQECSSHGEWGSVADAISISRFHHQRRKAARWARRHGVGVGAPSSYSNTSLPGGYLNGVFIEAKAVKGSSLLGRCGESNDSRLSKEEALEHLLDTGESVYDVSGVSQYGIGSGMARSRSNSRTSEFDFSPFPLSGFSRCHASSSTGTIHSSLADQGKRGHYGTSLGSNPPVLKGPETSHGFLFNSILTIPALPPAALDDENLAIYNIAGRDWPDEGDSELRRQSSTSRSTSLQTSNPRSRSNSVGRGKKEGIMPMAHRSTNQKGRLHISVPELHLSQRRLHKPLCAQRSIEQAAQKREECLQQFASAGHRIDRITGKTGGGVLRPDVAFGLAMETVIDLALKEEMLLRSAFGLTTGPEMEVQVAIVEAMRGEGRSTSIAHLPPLEYPSIVALPPHEVAYLRQLSMRELFCGDGNSPRSLVPRDGERKLRRLKPSKLLAAGPRLLSGDNDCKGKRPSSLAGMPVGVHSGTGSEYAFITRLSELHNSNTPFLAYAEGAEGISMDAGDGPSSGVMAADDGDMSYDDDNYGNDDDGDLVRDRINIARRGEDWREGINERRKRKGGPFVTQGGNLLDPYSIVDEDMHTDDILPIVVDSDAVSDYYVGSASSSSSCDDEPLSRSSDIYDGNNREGHNHHRYSHSTSEIGYERLSKRDRKLYKISKGGGRHSRAVQQHLIERNALKGCFYHFVSRVLTEKCDKVYVPAMLCMVESVIGVVAEDNNNNTNNNNISQNTSHLREQSSPSTGLATTIPLASHKTINTYISPVQRSYFLMNILLKVRRKLVASLHLFTYQQIQSILYCSHKYLEHTPLTSSSPGGVGGGHSSRLFGSILNGKVINKRQTIIPCFSRLPVFLSRMEATHYALDLSLCSSHHRTSTPSAAVSYKYFDSFVLDMVEFIFNMLDTISLVGNDTTDINNDIDNEYSGDIGGRAKLILTGKKTTVLSRLFSNNKKDDVSSHLSTAKSTKATMKGYLMQYIHNAFFCCTYASLPPHSHCHTILAPRYHHCTRMRDYYEELYLVRLIFADAFPSFSSFILTAEGLSSTYSIGELSHNRSVAKDAVQEVATQLQGDITEAMKRSASRIRRHFTDNIKEGGTAEDAFHRGILAETWKHYVALVKRKVSFLGSMLVSWPTLRGVVCGVSPRMVEDVARLAAADA